MSLSSLHLDAFYAAAQTQNFSQAAKELHITQSALSQRIKSLEEDLSLSLFVRMPRGVALTDAGNRLFRYCQARSSFETELLDDLCGGDDSLGLSGHLRIASYPSVARSIVIPALASLLLDHPRVEAHVQTAAPSKIAERLVTGHSDLVVTNRPVDRADIDSTPLGYEEFVLVGSASQSGETSVLLQGTDGDTTTEKFFASQERSVPSHRHVFLDGVYAVRQGVRLGLGRAVLPRHLVAGDPALVVDPSYKPLAVAVVLQYIRQVFHTKLHAEFVSQITKSATERLVRHGPAV